MSTVWPVIAVDDQPLGFKPIVGWRFILDSRCPHSVLWRSVKALLLRLAPAIKIESALWEQAPVETLRVLGEASKNGFTFDQLDEAGSFRVSQVIEVDQTSTYVAFEVLAPGAKPTPMGLPLLPFFVMSEFEDDSSENPMRIAGNYTWDNAMNVLSLEDALRFKGLAHDFRDDLPHRCANDCWSAFGTAPGTSGYWLFKSKASEPSLDEVLDTLAYANDVLLRRLDISRQSVAQSEALLAKLRTEH